MCLCLFLSLASQLTAVFHCSCVLAMSAMCRVTVCTVISGLYLTLIFLCPLVALSLASTIVLPSDFVLFVFNFQVIARPRTDLLIIGNISLFCCLFFNFKYELFKVDDVNVCPARSTESSRRCSTLALLVCEILFLAFSTLGFTAVLCLKSIPYSCFTEF